MMAPQIRPLTSASGSFAKAWTEKKADVVDADFEVVDEDKNEKK